MSKINVIDKIIAINNEVTPGTYQAVDNINTYVGDVVNGYQDRSINYEDKDILDRISKLSKDDIAKFLDDISSAKDPKDPMNIINWSSKQFMALQSQIADKLKDDKDHLGPTMGQVQSLQNVFNSYTTQQLSAPQALQKEVQGVVTQIPSRMQVALDAGTSLMALIGLYANLPKN